MITEAVGLALVSAGWLAAAATSVAGRRRLLDRVPAHRHVPPAGEHSRSGWLARVARWWGWGGRVGGFALVATAAAVAGGLAGDLVAGPVAAVAASLGTLAGLRAWLRRGRAADRAVAEVQLREAVRALAAGLRAGRSVRLALEESARDADPPLRDELAAAVDRLGVGEPLPEVLGRLARRLDLPDAHLLIAVLDLHRRVGGDLPTLLDEVSGVLGQRVEARRQARALTAQGRASGAVLAVLPVAFVTLLSWTGGDGLGDLYRTPRGSALLLAGLVLDGLGFAWVRRIVRAAEGIT